MATVTKDFISRYGVQGTVLKSTVAIGTAPLQVTSTTVVPNLNADMVDGLQASAFGLISGHLGQFAATTSLQLKNTISDETGSGALVFGTSPAITTSLTTPTASFDLLNTTATTINFGGGASTAINMGHASGTVVIAGNLTVNGTTTTINSTVISVDDKNVILGDVTSPNNTTADGGGFTLKGATDKTFNWVNATSAWTSSEHIDLASGKGLYHNGVSLLSSTTLASTVTSAAGLATVGTITSGTWSGSFGAVSGANLTSLTAGNLSGTIPSAVLGNSTVYIGTTAVALNRGSASLVLTGITSIDGSAATAGKATNLVGGNGTTLLGSMPYQSGVDTTTLLAPNTSANKRFLRMTGTGTNGAAPAWDSIVDGDIPSALTGKTYNGLTVTSSTGTLTIAALKVVTVSNTLTFTGTDSSSVAFGTGGTVAYLASPTFTGTPAAPTAAVDTNTTQLATTAYVVAQGYLKSATASSTYAPLASPTFTGTVTAALLDLTTAATATAATNYFVDTTSDGILRPKTLANVKTEIVTTAAVNAALATSVGTVTTGVWNAGAVTSSGLITGTGLGGSLLSATTPANLGVAAAGTATIPARADHVHATTGVAVVTYQTTAPGSPNVGDIWVDSDETLTTLNSNDYALKSYVDSLVLNGTFAGQFFLGGIY